VRTLVALIVISGTTCLAQQPRIESNTAGMNNGYLWDEGSPGEKQVYVTGIADDVFLQSVVPATKPGAANAPDASLYPNGFLITDIVQGIDAFYKDRTNMKVPIAFSYLYVMSKIKGASQQELDAMAARFRQRANQRVSGFRYSTAGRAPGKG
jgi:hypothetical protein